MNTEGDNFSIDIKEDSEIFIDFLSETHDHLEESESNILNVDWPAPALCTTFKVRVHVDTNSHIFSFYKSSNKQDKLLQSKKII